jgi:RNA polymerase sigma-70 factor (ECF subfamily)
VSFERDLLQRAHQFDAQALGEIYDRYSPGLYRYAARLLGGADWAEECVAEVFSRFLHALRHNQGPREHLQAYLYRVAHNWITDQWRRQPPPPLPLGPNLRADDEANPSVALLAQAEQECVRAALRLLTPEQRQVVTLKFLEDWENEQIAAALGKPVGAVKSLQHRALAALRRMLISEQDGDAVQ